MRISTEDFNYARISLKYPADYMLDCGCYYNKVNFDNIQEMLEGVKKHRKHYYIKLCAKW